MAEDPAGADVDDVERLWARVTETTGLERAGVLDELGGVLVEAEQELEAIAVVEAARVIYEEAGEPVEVARCDRNLGLLAMGLDRYDEAIVRYRAACEVYDGALLLTDAAGCRQAMAELTAAGGDHLAALGLFDKAAGAFADGGDLVRAAWCRFDAAGSFVELDDLAGATESLDVARQLFREERAYLFVARVDGLRAEIARRQGRFDDALALLEAARAVFESAGSDGEADRCDDGAAEVLIDAGRAEDAVAALEQTREQRRSAGNAVGVAWCDLHLSRAYRDLGRDDEAAISGQAARAVFDAAGFDDVLTRHELQTS